MPVGEHRRPRGIGGTHPGRVSLVRNVATPLGSGHDVPVGSTVRKAGFPSGRRMAQEANAGGRKAAGNRDVDGRLLRRPSRITGRIRAAARTRKGADVGQVSLWRDDGTTPEPKDKLDADLASMAVTAGAGAVNGPEDETLDWHVDRLAGGRGRRTASAAEDLHGVAGRGPQAKVRNLQKLMLRAAPNTLVSVRRVTEINAGRKTAGVDGRGRADRPGPRPSWRCGLHRQRRSWQARPVKRVYIPKANGKQRPLGIPVIADRVLQARVVNALEPEWEARFEPKSYGFRPGRGCQDAIAAIYLTLKGKNPQRPWVLDADLTAAFDRIDHDHLLAQLGTFPARGLVEGWLKAGVVDDGRFAPTEEGTPQGGVVSPLLLNVALHGMEEAAGVRYRKLGTHAAESVEGSPVLIRYADDLVVLCHSRDQAEQVKAQLAAWLRPRGLAFNEDKTRIVHVEDGFRLPGVQRPPLRRQAADQTEPRRP